MSRRMPAMIRVQRMRCTGGPRGTPRIDGEQAEACAKGCNACVARVAREGHPGSTVSRRGAAQKETSPMQAATTSIAGRPAFVLEVLGAAAVYFVTARLGLELAVVAPQVSIIWPAT